MKALDQVVKHLDECIEGNQDRLADGGRDRTYTIFSRLLEHLYMAYRDLLPSQPQLGDSEVGAVKTGAGG